MEEEEQEEWQGWRVVEGPGTETTDEDVGPSGRDLGKEPAVGAGYGASTGGVEGEPGLPGPAPGEIPEHTGPLAIEGIDLPTASEQEQEEEIPEDCHDKP